MVKTTAMFSFCDNEESDSITFSAANESRPEVGSSKIKTVGLETNSKATDNLRFSPPDKPGDIHHLLWYVGPL